MIGVCVAVVVAVVLTSLVWALITWVAITEASYVAWKRGFLQSTQIWKGERD